MTTSDLAIVILVTTVAFFVVSKLSRRGGKNAASLVLVSRLLAVLILGLAAFYFYKRFGG